MTIFNSEDSWPQRPWVGRTSTLGRCSQHLEISDALGILKELKNRFILAIYIHGIDFIPTRLSTMIKMSSDEKN